MRRRPSSPSRPLPPGPGGLSPAVASAWRLVGLGGAVVLAALAADRYGVLAPLAAARPWLAGAVGMAGLALALVLRQGRTVLALLLLASLHRGASASAPGPTRQLLIAGLPLLLALLPLLPEHRPWGRRGVLSIGLLCALLGLPWLLAPWQPAGPARALAWLAALPPALPSAPASSAAPLAAALLVALLLLVHRRDAPRRAALWSLVALGAGHSATAAGVATWIVVAALAWVASSVETAHALSFQDSLTRLPSRRALERELGELGRTFTVAMLDIDHFKQVNDRHGHEVGDQVLSMVGSRLAHPGGGGRAFRYGGEEFTLLFPGKPLAQARPILEELRLEIARQRFTLRSGNRPKRRPGRPTANRQRTQLSVTVSIGAAERNDHLRTPQEVLGAADRALYLAKRAGRNRVRAQLRGERR